MSVLSVIMCVLPVRSTVGTHTWFLESESGGRGEIQEVKVYRLQTYSPCGTGAIALAATALRAASVECSVKYTVSRVGQAVDTSDSDAQPRRGHSALPFGPRRRCRAVA